MSTLKTFTHPQKVYRLQYPAHWENLQKDNARSCGFGPEDRDDVGLWISIMPASIDTDRVVEHLHILFDQSLEKVEAKNRRRDTTLKHYALKADIIAEGQGGHYWLIAGGDVVLFASSQVPIGERDEWNPLMEKVMASMEIMRDDELVMRKAANEVLQQLKRKFPDKKFENEDKGIKCETGIIHLGNLYRDVARSPKRWQSITRNFMDGIIQSIEAPPGSEEWDDVRDIIFPMVKPAIYLEENTATEHMYHDDWLADYVICYAIKSNKVFRYLTAWDLDRWSVDADDMKKAAMKNLTDLPWPKRLEGAKQRGGGRVILVETGDDLAASRILHPELHKLFSGPLGNPFWAGIPERSTLVVFSDRKVLKKRIARQVRKDYDASGHAIAPRPFLVTADGIALGGES